MRTITILLTLITLAYPLARAEILEIPFPTITGGLDTYQAAVTYAGDSIQFSSVSLRLELTLDALGYLECECAPGCGMTECYFPPYFTAHVWKNDAWEDKYVVGEYAITQIGDFDETYIRDTNPVFDNLFDGDVIHVRLGFVLGRWCCLPWCPVCYEEPQGTITSVKLIIDTSPFVPVKHTTWSQIKNLYH